MALCAAFCVAGCAGPIVEDGLPAPEARPLTAQEIARGANLAPMVVEAGGFRLAAFARFGPQGGPAHVYIEGDGIAWVTRDEVSPDPTPGDPVALRLAAADPAAVVIYLARPCQFPALTGQAECDEKYWTTARTAPEVVKAYRHALDRLKARYGVSAFELVGFSGGAAVAALAAAGRHDVLSLRTVAGNLDYATFTRMHGVSPMTDSVDPATAAEALRGTPQVHFIGGRDDIVFPEVIQAWRAHSGEARCLQIERVDENGHANGWAGMWLELLRVPARCG